MTLGEKSPPIRLLHQLGRSGGTVIAKCLAVMDGVVLLSEIHPSCSGPGGGRGRPGAGAYLPLEQAWRWFGLVSREELDRLGRGPAALPFDQQIGLIARRCAERGKQLVLRDYNQVDFTGVLFLSDPPYRFMTFEALRPRFAIVRACTVRHPLDQWLSLRRYVAAKERLDLGAFLRGYRAFAEQAKEIGFIRYEDFALDPEGGLRELCGRLQLAYDSRWRERWRDYRKITGDAAARMGAQEIGPVPRTRAEPALVAELEANPDYARSIELLGYEPHAW